ncbi:MAG: S8 family serine peptidase [Oscillospiraceae bacterium]|nr:S8 family serine peptidase [Oscillospiraceae bacterium]
MSRTWKRLLSILLAAAMVLSLGITGWAIDDGKGETPVVTWEKVDDSVLPLRHGRGEVTELGTEVPEYADDEVVRVSIVLDKASTLEVGYATRGIAENPAAMSYREGLRSEQDALASRISAEALNGRELDVVWNLTLAANIISANVQYGQIEAIKDVRGVKDVVLETRYEPQVAESSDSPMMGVAASMTGGQMAWAEGYTGAGMQVAIVDTGVDTDHQSFDAGAFEYAIEETGKEVELLTEEDVAAVLPRLNAASRYSLTAADLYLNAKIPFAFNYVDRSLDVTHDNDTQGEHGSHVAGIAAANRFIPDGEGGYVAALDSVKTQGEAPDAQIIAMKVFGKGGGAYDSDYMVAIEDAIMIGCEAINLSLGSGVAGRVTNATYADILDSFEASDTVVVMSAGNSGYWAESSFLADMVGTGYPYGEDKYFDTVGSPGSYTNTLAVASVDNDGQTGGYLEAYGATVFYAETSGYGNEPISTIAGEHEYVLLDGPGVDDNDHVGAEGDGFLALGSDIVSGKIAICYRGSSSFFAKANAAAAQGAIGVIIINNQAGVINMNLTGYNYSAPAVSILKTDGDAIKAQSEKVTTEGDLEYYTGTLNVSDSIATVVYGSDYYTMSSFSSWGVPGDLSLKPEITAPGGSIYSVFGSSRTQDNVPQGGSDKYELMSGTSMAAPQVTGLSAVVAQYVKENGLDAKTGLTVRQITQSLLMSTASPMIDANSGCYYPVMQQGAGLANVAAVVSAKSVLTVNGGNPKSSDGKVKVELGELDREDPSFTVNFNLKNITDEAVTYDLNADFFTQDYFAYYVFSTGGQRVGITYYGDTYAVPLASAVSWSVNGVPYAPITDLSYDFDGNGLVNVADAQALLDYTAGLREIANLENADFDEDGDVDTHDAQLALVAFGKASATVEPNDEINIVASVKLLDIEDYDLNGAYVEGYVFATEIDTGDGAIGVSHSIPVLGFYGNWTDSTMFDHGGYLNYIYDLGDYTPYLAVNTDLGGLGSSANYLKSYIRTDTAGDQWYMGGNPVYRDDEYIPERDAMNAADTLSSVEYTLIRNAAGGRLTVTDEDGNELFHKDIGPEYSAYYYVNGATWRNTYNTKDIGFKPEGLEDGTVLTATLTMAPEYYVDDLGNIDYEALGDGASYSFSFQIDSTDPVLEDVDIHYSMEKGGFDKITLKASDNQYIAGMWLCNEDGDSLLDFGPDYEAEPGAVTDFTFDLTEAYESLADIDEHLFIEIYDYAANRSVYKINLNAQELNGDLVLTVDPAEARVLRGNTTKLTVTAEPWGASEKVTWTSSDETVATVNENGVVTGVGVGTATITATSEFKPDVTASAEIEVFTIPTTLVGGLQDENGVPLVFMWDVENDDTWLYAGGLEHSITAMSYDWNTDDGEFVYQQDDGGYMYKVSLNDLEAKEASEATTAFGAPMEDIDFPFVTNMLNGTHMAFAVAEGYLLFANDIMENTFNRGYNLSPYLNNYTGASQFVAIAWAGAMRDDDNNLDGDYLMLLDNAGYLWLLSYGSEGLDLYNFFDTGLGTSFPFVDETTGNSLLMGDDGEFYLAHFNGSTSEIYQLPYNSATGEFESIRIGDVGPDVWPAAIFMAAVNQPGDPEGTDSFREPAFAKDTAMVSSIDEVELYAAEKENEDAPIAVLDEDDLIILEPVGGLNAAPENAPIVRPQTIGTENPAVQKIELTADEDTTNGLYIFEYDAENLNFDGYETFTAYKSVNIEDGKVTFAYMDEEAIPAGTKLAVFTFSVKDDDKAGKVIITTQEINEKNPAGVPATVVIVGNGELPEEPFPVLTEAFNSATGVRVSWNALEGFDSYRVMRKNITEGVDETEWSVIAETTELTYIDTTAKSASRYTYTVQAFNSESGLESGCDEVGRTCTYIARAEITSLESSFDGVVITWNKPAGAKNFRVFRQDENGKWIAIADVEGTTFTDPEARVGVKTWYTVRAITMAGDMYINSYNATGHSIKRAPMPKLTEAFNSATGVRVSWEGVEQAASYIVLRKNVTLGETEWHVVGETEDVTFIDKTAKSSNRYTYTVQLVEEDGTVREDLRDETGRTCTYIAKADITSLKNEDDGVKIEWTVPAGAKNFRVMRKTADGNWQVIAEVMGSEFTDTTAESGVKYWYTVRAITLDGKMCINSYNSFGWSITRS